MQSGNFVVSKGVADIHRENVKMIDEHSKRKNNSAHVPLSMRY